MRLVYHGSWAHFAFFCFFGSGVEAEETEGPHGRLRAAPGTYHATPMERNKAETHPTNLASDLTSVIAAAAGSELSFLLFLGCTHLCAGVEKGIARFGRQVGKVHPA